MARKFLPCIMLLPVLVAAWLTFTAPVASALAPDQIVAYDYTSAQEESPASQEIGEVVAVTE